MGTKKLAAACVFLFFSALLFAEEENYYAAMQNLREENAVLGFVRAEIEASGGSLSSQDFSDFAGGHSFSHILQTTVSGTRDDTLIIAAPAVSGGSGFNAALALSLWKKARANAPPVTLIFLFLGGDGESVFPAARDTGFPAQEYLGTRLFLESFFSEHPVSVLYLDFTGPPAKILCETGIRG
ncbi:MAG: hypothetical protein LBT68_02975, partial [Spirochaetales bacterium]|nr:hypothetical protein [Spirochaetales bacterium]